MDIHQLRQLIDDIDAQLVSLIRRRAEAAREIGKQKRGAGKAALDTAREEQILRKVAHSETEPLSAEAMKAIFGEIISACRALEEQVTVAYLGPAYTFTHLAARHRFGAQVNYLDCATVDGVFEAVERGMAGFGVVPVENSLSGAVPETLDRFMSSDLTILGEHYEPIEHCLLATCEVAEVRRLHTHPQARAQCLRWIREHLRDAEIINQSSTAAAAKAAAAETNAGAIAPKEAAEAYGLRIVARGIQDVPDNRTRFFIIGHGSPGRTGKDKTSIVFATQHRAGALHEALTPLREYGVNMTMIQSRPVPGRLGEYVFFVDLEGHSTDSHVADALEKMKQVTFRMSVLGSYPAAD